MGVAVEETSQPCPECGTEIRTDLRFIRWCAECDWNVDPGPPEEEKGRRSAARRARARRDGEKLLRRLREEEAADGATGRGGGGLSTVLVHAVAFAVHAVTLSLAVGAVWCLVHNRGGLGVLLGVVLLVIAWSLRPRLSRLPKDVHAFRRGDAPALYGLIDEVARVVGTRGVDLIVVDKDINASVTTCGLRRQRVMRLGLPLWEMLAPQQRVALLGHELGHYTNGDTRRGIVIATAYNSLRTWRYYLAPTPDPTPVEFVVNVVYLAPRALILGVLLVLDRLTATVSQRGEYLADSYACQAGSTDAAAGLMDKLMVGDAAATTLQREANKARGGPRGPGRADEGADSLWERFFDDVESIPEREYERRRRVGALRGHSVDASHPPTHLRRERLRASVPVTATVVLSDEDEKRISAELAVVRRRIATEILREGFEG